LTQGHDDIVIYNINYSHSQVSRILVNQPTGHWDLRRKSAQRNGSPDVECLRWGCPLSTRWVVSVFINTLVRVITSSLPDVDVGSMYYVNTTLSLRLLSLMVKCVSIEKYNGSSLSEVL